MEGTEKGSAKVRNYTIGLAVGIIAAALIGYLFFWQPGVALDSRVQHQASEKSKQYANPSNITIEGECPSIPTPDTVNCISQKQDTANQRQRDIRDLEAQQSMAVWTRIMGKATIVAMGVGIIGLALVFTTFREARRAADAGFAANKIARKIGEAQVRCYPSVSSVDVTLDDLRPTKSISPSSPCMEGLEPVSPIVKFKITNHGNSPMKDLNWGVSMKYGFFDPIESSHVERQSIENFPVEPNDGGGILAAQKDEEIETLFGFSIPRQTAQQYDIEEKRQLLFVVVIALGYRDVFDNVLSDTFAFSGRLYWKHTTRTSPCPVLRFQTQAQLRQRAVERGEIDEQPSASDGNGQK